MNDNDLMDAMADAVAEFVERATAPLLARISKLESDLATRPTAEAHAEIVARSAIAAAAAVPRPEAVKGDPGEVDEAVVRRAVDDALRAAVASLPAPLKGDKGEDGQSVHADTIRLMILEEVAKAIGIMPRAENGKSVTVDEVRPVLEEMVARAVGAIPKPKDGDDGEDAVVDYERIKAMLPELIPEPIPGTPGEVDYTKVYSAIQDLLDQKIAALPKPKDGTSVTLEQVQPLVDTAVKTAVAAIPVPKDGASVTAEDVRPMLAELVLNEVKTYGQAVIVDDVRPAVKAAVAEAVATLPVPENGKSVTLDDVRPLIAAEVERQMPEPIEPLPPDDEAIARVVQECVARAVDALPAPKDGASVDPETVRDMVRKAVAELPPAERGEPGDKGADADPALMARMVEDETKRQLETLRPQLKGDPGEDADLKTVRDIVDMAVKAAVSEIRVPELDMDEVERLVRRRVEDALSSWERPKDGSDGLGLEDLSVDLKEDGRTLVLKFANREREKTFEIECPWLIYRGLYQSGSTYQKGDTVTYAGSQYIAIRDTKDVPPKSPDWQLAVKSGKDAK